MVQWTRLVMTAVTVVMYTPRDILRAVYDVRSYQSFLSKM